jgi:hypothetical protein
LVCPLAEQKRVRSKLDEIRRRRSGRAAIGSNVLVRALLPGPRFLLFVEMAQRRVAMVICPLC